MRVDIADPTAEQRVAIDEHHDFVVVRYDRLRQVLQIINDLHSPSETAKGKFSSDKGMGQNPPVLEQRRQRSIFASQIIDPDGTID